MSAVSDRLPAFPWDKLEPYKATTELWKGITRREPSVKVRMALQQIGMILLLALMAFLLAVTMSEAANNSR